MHDQPALKWTMQQHLTRITHSAAFWNGSTVARLERGVEPGRARLQDYVAHASVLRAESDFGFVGMHVPHRPSQVRHTRSAASTLVAGCSEP